MSSSFHKKNSEEKKVDMNDINDNIIDVNVEWDKFKIINLFNLDLTNESFDNLLNKIKKFSIENNAILSMTKNCESLILCKNKLNKIDLNKILDIFPNLLNLDISHNNITTILYTNNDTTKYSLSSIDVSYNNISEFSNIITLLKYFENISDFIFYSNPYNKEFECLIEKPTKLSITPVIFHKNEKILFNHHS